MNTRLFACATRIQTTARCQLSSLRPTSSPPSLLLRRSMHFSSPSKTAAVPSNLRHEAKPPPPPPPPRTKPKKSKEAFNVPAATSAKYMTPPPTKTMEEQQAAYGVTIRRTPSGLLPLYAKRLSGNTRTVLYIKKIDGDLRRLVGDIRAGINVPADKIRINPTTQHIEVSGQQNVEKLRQWLLSQGF